MKVLKKYYVLLLSLISILVFSTSCVSRTKDHYEEEGLSVGEFGGFQNVSGLNRQLILQFNQVLFLMKTICLLKQVVGKELKMYM